MLHIRRTSEEKVFKIMEITEISKAAGIDKLPGKFLKDSGEVLSKPIIEICNLSISHGIFPNASKVANSNLFSKKTKKSTHLITDLSHYCH